MPWSECVTIFERAPVWQGCERIGMRHFFQQFVLAIDFAVQIDGTAPHSDACQQFARIERLGQVIISTRRQALYHFVLFRDARQHDDVGIGMLKISANVLAQLQSGEIRHHPVGDHD